jgi:CRISPR-associated protein Cas5h
MKPLDKILCFKISGRFAHFRKFYTNASSLSYLIPPRTVMIGMLGSILKLPRDSYYDLFNEDDCKISAAISPTAVIKKTTQSINMLHLDYYKKFLVSGKTGFKSMHSPCKVELLISTPGNFIEYLAFVAVPSGSSFFPELEKKLKQQDRGFGIYLGQRPFRAYAQYLETYSRDEILFPEEAGKLDSLCLRENVLEISENEDVHIVIEQMPIHMKQVADEKKLAPGRETTAVKRVLFERNGKTIYGRFKNCCKIGDRVISFY